MYSMNLYVELLSIYRIKEWQADNCIQCDGDSAPVHWWQEYNGCGKKLGRRERFRVFASSRPQRESILTT